MKEGVIPAQEIEYSGSGLFYEYPAILPAARNAGLVERSGSSCVWMVDEENECLVVGEQLEKMVMGKGGDLLRLGSEDTWVGLYFRRDRGSCEWSRVTLEQTLEGEGEVYVTGAVKRVYGDEKYEVPNVLLRISGSVGEKKVQIYRSEDEDQVVLYPFGLAVFAPPSVFLAEVAVEGEEQLPEEENREEMSEALEGREKSADQEEALGAGEIEPEALDRRGGEAGGEAVGVQVEDQNLATLRGTSQAGLLGTRHGSDLPEVRSPEEILAGAVPMGGSGYETYNYNSGRNPNDNLINTKAT